MTGLWTRRRHTILLLTAVAGLFASPAWSTPPYTWSVGLLGGVGGVLDADEDEGLGRTSFQVNLEMVREARTHLGLRIGQLDLERVDGYDSVDLTYATIVGEYRFSEGFYDSGLYLGLGAYQLEHSFDEETAIGVAFGLTGDFPINGHWSARLELSAHYADLEATNLFGIGHVGVMFHW